MTVNPTTLRSISQAAKALPFSEPSLRNKIERGELNVVKICGNIYLEESELCDKFGDLYQPR